MAGAIEEIKHHLRCVIISTVVTLFAALLIFSMWYTAAKSSYDDQTAAICSDGRQLLSIDSDLSQNPVIKSTESEAVAADNLAQQLQCETYIFAHVCLDSDIVVEEWDKQCHSVDDSSMLSFRKYIDVGVTCAKSHASANSIPLCNATLWVCTAEMQVPENCTAWEYARQICARGLTLQPYGCFFSPSTLAAGVHVDARPYPLVAYIGLWVSVGISTLFCVVFASLLTITPSGGSALAASNVLRSALSLSLNDWQNDLEMSMDDDSADLAGDQTVMPRIDEELECETHSEPQAAVLGIACEDDETTANPEKPSGQLGMNSAAEKPEEADQKPDTSGHAPEESAHAEMQVCATHVETRDELEAAAKQAHAKSMHL